MRVEPPDPYYPTPAAFSDTQPSCQLILRRIFAHIQRFALSFVCIVTRSITFDWWHPAKLGGRMHNYSQYLRAPSRKL